MIGDNDRLSVLPDDVILKVLGFIGLKESIRTSVLSSRWRNVWTSIPHLNFSSQDFSTMEKLSESVTHVLSRRDPQQLMLSSFTLDVIGLRDGQDVAHRIINNAFSSKLNVQQLNITCIFNNFSLLVTRPEIPLSLTGSPTLKHLTLNWRSDTEQLLLTTRGAFSVLTTLHLHDVILGEGDSFLSMCPNLESLTLHRCKMRNSASFLVHHPRLFNLALENGESEAFEVNVVTPQLKDLTISEYFGGFTISAPQLTSLLINGYCPYMFTTKYGFPFLEKVQLSLHSLEQVSRGDAFTVTRLLNDFHNVKFLSLTADVILLLNSSFSRKPRRFPLANLKSLKILPKVLCMDTHKPTKIKMSTEVEIYLLNGSPEATVTEVLREHCCNVGAGIPIHTV